MKGSPPEIAKDQPVLLRVLNTTVEYNGAIG